MKNVFLLIVFLLSFTACNDDEIKTVQVEVMMQLPTDIVHKNPMINKGTLILVNVNTGQKIVHSFTDTKLSGLVVEDGIYNVQAIAEVTYVARVAGETSLGNSDAKSELRGALENIAIKEGAFTISLPLFFYNASSDLVFSEIYFSWSKTPDEKIYSYDQFVEIYNNSDEVIYADGLCFGETLVKTTHIWENYTPSISRDEAVPIRIVYRIPGSGKEHPIKPGETFVFCDVAKNHKEENPNSVDLSKANFEWYDDYKGKDVDVVEVPNLECLVRGEKVKMYKLYSKGEHSYVLFRIPIDQTTEQFAKEHDFKYSFTLKDKTYERNAWVIKNSEIIDAVECTSPSNFKWKALAPSLDLTWTHSGDNDDARFGHSVKRKISHKEGERLVLQDTNDSAIDFIATASNPSPGTIEDHK